MTTSEAFPTASYYINQLIASTAGILKKNGVTQYCFNVVFILVYGTKKHILAAGKNLLLETNISQFVTTGANDYSDMRL